MLNDTGSHRVPEPPPFNEREHVRFNGQVDSPFVGLIRDGAVGVVLRNEPGRQGSGQAVYLDLEGDLLDVTIDGISVVLFEGGVTLSITAQSARFFVRERDLSFDPEQGNAP